MKKILFCLFIAFLVLAGCSQPQRNQGTPEDTGGPEIEVIPAPVGELTQEDLALLEVNEEECSSGPEYAPKAWYTWSWSDIGDDFCEKYYCDATQFSIFLLKKINAVTELRQADAIIEPINRSEDCSPEDCIQFDALLMKDGFGGSFQQDFDKYMRDTGFFDAPSFYLEGELGKVFADKEKFVFAASEIGRPGQYRVKARTPKNTDSPIVVEFELVYSDGLNNPFYYFPFNGKIGEDNQRDGYGLGYEVKGEGVQLGTGFEVSQSTQGGKFKALIEKLADIGKANAIQTKGTVLKLTAEPTGNQRTLEFSPLISTPVLMHSKIDTSSAGSIDLLYKAFYPENGEVDTGDSFLLWTPLDQCIGYSGKTDTVADNKNSVEEKTYSIHQELGSLLPEEKISKDVYYKTVVYSPTELMLSAKGTSLDGKMQRNALFEFITPHQNSPNVNLIGTPETTHNNPDEIISNIQQTFESIKKEEMCIQKIGDAENLQVKVYWNEKKIEEKIVTQIEVAQQQCSIMNLPEQCEDGTLLNDCSFQKPKFCEDFELVDRCDICSCSEGKICSINSQCVATECIADIDCNDNKDYTDDKCVNQNSFLVESGASTAQCLHRQKLTGNRELKLLIIEFAPENIHYGTLFLCENDDAGYQLTTQNIYCNQIVDSHSFLEITNDSSGRILFRNIPEHLKTPYSFFYLNDFLKKEANRHGVTQIPTFKIDIVGPLGLTDLPPQTIGVTNYYIVGDYFSQKINEYGIDTSGYDFLAVVYFNDQGLILSVNSNGSDPVFSTVDRHKFVNYSDVTQKTVYLSLDTFRLNEDHGSHVLIHELLHQFGATDTYVFGEGPNAPSWCSMFECCTLDGIPNPSTFPQTEGCIMCASGQIVIEYGEEGQANPSLDTTLICNKTAEEIGWK